MTLKDISRELHDEFGQMLTAIGSMLGRASRHTPDGSSLKADLHEIGQVAQAALDQAMVDVQAITLERRLAAERAPGKSDRRVGQRQTQGQQRQQRCRAAAAVVGHTEAERPSARTLERRAMPAVAVEHAGELDRLGAADAMGDQKGADLGFGGLARQHQIQALAGFAAAEAGAGVFTAAHLAQQLREAGSFGGQPSQVLTSGAQGRRRPCCLGTGFW